MDWKKIASKAKKTIDDRGGVDALKADAEELKRVAKGQGSVTDKAKKAAAAIKEPGAHRQGKPAGEQQVAREHHPGTEGKE